MSYSENLKVEPLTVDVKTAAKMLNVCERTLRTLTKIGELPVVKILGRVLYRPDDLIEFVQQKTQRALGDESDVATPN